MLQTTANTTACDKHTNCDKHLQIVTNTKKERKQKNVNSNFGALYFFVMICKLLLFNSKQFVKNNNLDSE